MKRNDWRPEEDELIIKGIGEFGEKWSKIKGQYPSIVARHSSKTAIQDRVKTWKSKGIYDGFMTGSLTPAGVLGTEVGEATTGGPSVRTDQAEATTSLGFYCICGNHHDWRSMLTLGVECSCDRSLSEMVKQVSAAFPWAVYILLGDIAMSYPVRYVGISHGLQARLTSHSHEGVRSGTFEDLRISIVLGETQLIRMLEPTDNIQGAGNSKLSNLMRIKSQASQMWKEISIDEAGGSCGYTAEYVDTTKFTIAMQDFPGQCNAGLLFTIAAPRSSKESAFCFLKDRTECQCKPRCYDRKVLNHLRGREIWDGIARNELKDTIKPYRAPVRWTGASSQAAWSEEFTASVLQRKRNSVKDTTVQENLGENRRMWGRGIMNLVYSPWELLSALKKSGTVHTQYRRLSLINSIISHMTNTEVRRIFGLHGHINLRREYVHLTSILSELRNQDSQKRTLREQTHWASMDEINVAVNEMSRVAVSIRDRQRVVWYQMMLEQATVRNDYRTLKVFKFNRETDNFVDLRKGEIVLNSYKTSPTRGRYTMKIKPQFVDAITNLYLERCELGHEYLFAKQDGGMYTTNGFSEYVMQGIKRFLGGRHVGSCMLRHVKITEMFQGEKSLSEKRKLADEMQHSVAMQAKYMRLGD